MLNVMSAVHRPNVSGSNSLGLRYGRAYYESSKKTGLLQHVVNILAWPFLVGGAICLVNSDNERDPDLLTSVHLFSSATLLRGTMGGKPMEVLGENRLTHRPIRVQSSTSHLVATPSNCGDILKL